MGIENQPLRFTLAVRPVVNTSTPNATLKVLLIEDNPGDARLIRAYLEDPAGAAFEVEQAATLLAGVERLVRGGIDLILLDLSLPDSPMPETFQRVHDCAPQVAIIVMSGLDDEQFAMQTVQEGAQDYLVKASIDTRLLVHSMRYAIERKRVSEALAQERELFHTLLDNLPDRIFFKDTESRFTRVSKALAEHFKISHPREAMGRRDHDYFTAEHADAALHDEQTIMRTGEPLLDKVERETLPDGGISWALTSKLPLKNRRGKVIGNFGISRDITSLKQVEEQRENERNLLRSLIDNLPDYIYVKDTGGRYLLDNNAHRRLLGVHSEKEILGKTSDDFFPPDMAAIIRADDARILASGLPVLSREEQVTDAMGNCRWHSTTKVPLRNVEGKISGLVAIGRDITRRKHNEQELARQQVELQRTLADLQKSHAELKSAQDLLIEAEKMQSIGRLAAGVAHEVKNPLGILGMGVEYLSKHVQSSDDNVALILTDMSEAIKRADGIIMGLLDFSVPHALDCHAEDLGALIEQSLVFVRHSLHAAGILLEKDIAPGLPPAWLDRNKIKQVFVNLLTNAIHATPEGGTLTVRTYARQLRADEVDRDAGSRLADRFHAGETVVVAEVLDTRSWRRSSTPSSPPRRRARAPAWA